MTERSILGSFAILLSLCVFASAIDRDASMIDTVSFEGMQYDGGDGIGVSLWGETVTAMKEQQWAILFGGATGTVWPDIGDGIDYWNIGLGMKYYLMQDTSLALLGSYGDLGLVGRPTATTVDLTLKHRFVPADETISPFIRAGIGTRNVEYDVDPVGKYSFDEMILSFGVGIDFMMADNFAFVFESTWFLPQELDDNESPDWWVGRIGMQYYWE